MNYETAKLKVTAKLIKNGNNEDSVSKLIAKHFDYAFSNYRTVKTMAECIICI